MGADAVLASLGADGQLLVDGAGAWFGSSRVDAVRSNAGGRRDLPARTSDRRWPRPGGPGLRRRPWRRGRTTARQRDAGPGRPSTSARDRHVGGPRGLAYYEPVS